MKTQSIESSNTVKCPHCLKDVFYQPSVSPDYVKVRCHNFYKTLRDKREYEVRCDFVGFVKTGTNKDGSYVSKL